MFFYIYIFLLFLKEWFELCDMVYCTAGGHTGGHDQQQHIGRLWCLYNAQLELSGKSLPRIDLTHITSPTAAWIIDTKSSSDPTIWIPQQKSRLVRPRYLITIYHFKFWWAHGNCSFSLLFSADWSVLLFCCNSRLDVFNMFRNAHVKPLVVTSGYLHYFSFFTNQFWGLFQ